MAALASLQGLLLPSFHRFYWFGLNTSDGSSWVQMDRTINTTYKSWGTFKPGPGQRAAKEPNNLFDPEYCAGANFTELIPGKAPVWGWGDEQCTLLRPVMCRSIGESVETADRQVHHTRWCGAASCCVAVGSTSWTLQHPSQHLPRPAHNTRGQSNM
jgi:hypothetical protein